MKRNSSYLHTQHQNILCFISSITKRSRLGQLTCNYKLPVQLRALSVSRSTAPDDHFLTTVDWVAPVMSCMPVDRTLSGLLRTVFSLPLNSDLCIISFNEFKKLFRCILSPLSLPKSEPNSNEHLAKSTCDLGLSAPNEIDTRSRRN